ncbi:glutathione synthase [Coemansia reversa NRRL 1564]|uniref:Glutathione synthetase n=1 Tax=Coemansia reversa (strain ATCC 12441 / NRRL 1564) TaxID=763665 RepID=A0A2G5BAE0_COERN|nr:glutathione synthase [Coemansia reversa NRRL 1564]|eukprot:PIA15974.1 glutathione synthase [Coemansia reversa NRRL 1564]
MFRQINKFAKTNSEFLSLRPRYTQDVKELRGSVDMAIDWEATHGLLMQAPKLSHAISNADWVQTALVPAPVSLAPSPIPRAEFEKVVALQPVLNQLFDSIARDHDFLVSTLESLGTADEFTTRIFSMYMKQYVMKVEKPAVVGIHRSDYLIHAPANEPDASPQAKQVEFNTIASSFASLSAIVGDFHRFMLERTGFQGLLKEGQVEMNQLPENESLTSIGDGIAVGFELYGTPSAVVAMVIQPDERNVYDQRWIEERLWKRHNIRVVRLSFADILDQCSIREDNRLFAGDTEIAVAYYRAGYAPTDFPTEKEWEGRWLVEKSRAIPIPNLAYHLAGCKKIQQVLAQPGVVERFVSDEETARRVRECFVGLYPLDDSEEGQQAYEMALKSPANYVAKPQREGGGYNSYGEDIPKLLCGMSVEERRGYILMELIKAPGFDSMLLRNGQLVPAEVVSELGIYGIWVSDSKGDMVVNRHGGHLLRTKASNVHEGGVAAGFAVIDSPLLV